MEKKAKKVVIGDSRIVIDEEGIKTNRPDAAVWLQNGTEESDIMIMDNESEINLNATQGAKSIFPSTEEVKVMGESQLKRIEEKLERVIGLLEGKRLDDSSSGKLTTVYSSDQDA